MAPVTKISRDDVELPETLDVLFHLPVSAKLRKDGFIIAHAIQYNVCVKGTSQEQALQKLADGVVARCELAVERGVHPLNMAPEDYMKAFFMGTPVEETEAMCETRTRLSKELRERFHVAGTQGIALEMRMRTVVAKQNKLGVMRIPDLVAQAA